MTGRYLLADRTEWICQTVDMSATGMLLRGQARPFFGQMVIVYLDGVGRVEGTVTRLEASQFALRINATERKRQQLEALLPHLAKGEHAPNRVDPSLIEGVARQGSARPPQPPANLAPPSAPPAAQSYAAFRIYLDSL